MKTKKIGRKKSRDRVADIFQFEIGIGDRKVGTCLQLYGQVCRQPKCCRSASLDPKGRAFCQVSGSPLPSIAILISDEDRDRNRDLNFGDWGHALAVRTNY